MIIDDIPSIMIQPLPNALIPDNTKTGFLLIGIWTCHPYKFTDEDVCPCKVAGSPVHDSMSPESLDFQISHFQTRI
jgi:hypothetical protein